MRNVVPYYGTRRDRSTDTAADRTPTTHHRAMTSPSDEAARGPRARREASPDSPNPVLTRDLHDRVLLLTIDRPQRLNAVTREVYAALVRAFSEAEADGRIRAVVITGAGRAFCVGADLKAHGSDEPTPEERKSYVASGQRANRALQTSRLPVVAAVNGHAIGAGLELALSADMVVVASEAKLRFPETALGTFVGGGVSYTLPARVGMARARELLLLGDFFTPDEALGMGLANRVAPAEEVLPLSLELAESLASRAPRSVARMKALLRDALHLAPDEVLRREEQSLLACMGTHDWREGLAAFRDRRPPRFTGE